MFDVGLAELAVVALVALLVLGPERLPRAARTVGLYVRKARQSWYAVRADIERELAADDLRRSMKQAGESVREAATGAGDALASTAQAVREATAVAAEPPQAPAGRAAATPRTSGDPAP